MVVVFLVAEGWKGGRAGWKGWCRVWFKEEGVTMGQVQGGGGDDGRAWLKQEGGDDRYLYARRYPPSGWSRPLRTWAHDMSTK